VTADDAMRAGPAWLEQVGRDAELPPLAFKVVFTLAFNVSFALDRAPEQSIERVAAFSE